MLCRLTVALSVMLVATACGTSPATRSERLAQTLDELVAFGSRVAATPPGIAAGDYVRGRMVAAGLTDVHFETFGFRYFALDEASFALELGGSAADIAAEPLAYSASGTIDADVAYAGGAREEDFEGRDVAGKMVLVFADSGVRRWDQARHIAERGGVAMLYMGDAADNLVQAGVVSWAQQGEAALPAFSVGRDDGLVILKALDDATPVHVSARVDAHLESREGRNVVGSLSGDSEACFVIGAHYDSWHAGAADNASGVASLLEIADAMGNGTRRRLGLRFVAYDAEEVGLLGGYDFLRKHRVVQKDTILAYLHFEGPGSSVSSVAYTEGPLRGALEQGGLDALYASTVHLDALPRAGGGYVPTDIQGMFRSGEQVLSTVGDSPYYHTRADTPDKVDLEFLTRSVDGFIGTLDALDAHAVADFDVHDPAVWRVEAAVTRAGEFFEVVAGVRDGNGVPVDVARLDVSLQVDDFTEVFETSVKLPASDGSATVRLPAAGVPAGTSTAFAHVTAGETYPLAETIVRMP